MIAKPHKLRHPKRRVPAEIVMDLTQLQREWILADYWAYGGSTCPHDRSRLKAILKLDPGGRLDYRLEIRCLRCGLSECLDRSHDRSRADFRPWLQQEVDAMAEAFYRRGSATCPVCATQIDANGQSAGNGPQVSLQCVRCGNAHVWMRNRAITPRLAIAG